MTPDPHEQPHPERLSRGARAARALSEVLWETLQDAVAENQTVRVAELSARLAEISLTVASLADAGHRPARERPRSATRPGGGEPMRARGPALEPVVPRPVASEPVVPRPMMPGPVLPEPVVPRPMMPGPVLPEPVVPEPVPVGETWSAEPSAAMPESERTSGGDTDLPPQHWPRQEHDGESDVSAAAAAAAAVVVDELAGHDQPEALGASRSERQAQANIEIRDERVPDTQAKDALIEHEPAQPEQPAQPEEPAQHGYREPAPAEPGSGPGPWIASIERRLERYQQDGHAFALLLLELADVQRLRHAELPGEVARLTTLVETELSAQLRPADSLMRETPGRYWLLAPQTDGSAAQALAEQMTAAVGRTASHRGAPLRLAVGIAVCPQDALDAAELVDRAEVALYRAHASGRALAPAADPSLLDDELD